LPCPVIIFCLLHKFFSFLNESTMLAVWDIVLNSRWLFPFFYLFFLLNLHSLFAFSNDVIWLFLLPFVALLLSFLLFHLSLSSKLSLLSLSIFFLFLSLSHHIFLFLLLFGLLFLIFHCSLLHLFFFSLSPSLLFSLSPSFLLSGSIIFIITTHYLPYVRCGVHAASGSSEHLL